MSIKNAVRNAAIMQNMGKCDDGNFNCNICRRQFAKKSQTLEHIETHIDGLQFPCQYCDYVAKSRHSLRDHVRKYHK